MTKHALGAAHADLMGVEFDNFDAEREEITLRFTAPDSFVTPRGSVPLRASHHPSCHRSFNVTVRVCAPRANRSSRRSITITIHTMR